jgi:hypothetical protein
VRHGGPVMLRFVFRHLLGGEVAETDLIESSLAEWLESKEQKDPAWSVSISGRKVRAVRLPLLRLYSPAGGEPSASGGFGATGSAVGQDEG